jgi:glycosyltransferase involved in cell wall biosynthesis
MAASDNLNILSPLNIELPSAQAGVIHWFNTVWQLAEAGANVYVMGGISPSSTAEGILEFFGLKAHPRLSINSARPWSFSYLNKSHTLRTRAYFLEVVHAIRAQRPQLLFGIGMPNHIWALAPLKRLSPFKIVLELHEEHCTTEQMQRCVRLMKEPNPLLDGIVTVSPAHRALLLEEGAKANRVHTFYAAHRPDLIPRTDRSSILKKLNLPIGPDSPIILYGGNLYGDRGVEVLLQAFKKVADEARAAHLVVLGTGDAKLEERFRSSNGLPKVHFTGRVRPPEVGDYLAVADIGVVPNPDRAQWKYGSPIKLSEYLGAGLAVVATNLETSAGLVGPQKAALLVKPDSPQEMAEAIIKLITDKPLRESMRERALKVGEELTYQARAESIYRFLADLIYG